MSETEVNKAQVMELESLTDLLRLVVSIMGRSNMSGHLYYAEKEGKHLYFLTHSVGGWYDLKGLPVTLVADGGKAPEHNFIEYKMAREGEEEGYSFVSEIKQSTQAIQIPIIKLKELPAYMY
jgi:hypothetical protein